MFIDGFMAAITFAAGGAEFFAALVATHTLQAVVLTFERKIGLLVIKVVAIEPDDIRRAPLVIGMTLLACECGSLPELAVKSFICRNIRCNHIVALHA